MVSEPRLLLSIHDVSPRFESETDRLRDHLAAHSGSDRCALLVVPNHWGDAPIIAGSGFAHRLRSWAEAGDEIFLHGWFHRDAIRHDSRIARLKASKMTAGEGEFLGLSRAEARDRMQQGQALLEDITGAPVAGFIAPAWLYGQGAILALSDCDFALSEDHWKVWSPRTGAVLARSPVLTWASRSPARIASSLLAARLLPLILRHAAIARVGVHPGDVRVPAILDSIAGAVTRLARSHRIARYADLANPSGQPCAS
jgi:predicted deacetylase